MSSILPTSLSLCGWGDRLLSVNRIIIFLIEIIIIIIGYTLQEDSKMIDYLGFLVFFVVAIMIIFIARRKEDTEFMTKWSISKAINPPGNIPERVKHGHGIHRIQAQHPQTFTYLCIEQNNLNTLKTIVDWQLTSLRRLYLKMNNISSIEQLNRILMPNLQVLVLSQNRITEFRGLRRLATPSLVWLQIHNNPCRQKFDFLAEMNLKDLMYMWVEFFANDQHMSDDLHWMAKCEAFYFSKFHANSDKRISQDNFQSALRRKYSALDLRIHRN